VQIKQQAIDLILRQCAAEGGHVAAAGEDDFANTLVVGGKAALGKIWVFEYALQTWAFTSVRGVGLVTAVALVVIDAAANDLFRGEAEFGVGLAALVAGGEQRGEQQRGDQG